MAYPRRMTDKFDDHPCQPSRRRNQNNHAQFLHIPMLPVWQINSMTIHVNLPEEGTKTTMCDSNIFPCCPTSPLRQSLTFFYHCYHTKDKGALISNNQEKLSKNNNLMCQPRYYSSTSSSFNLVWGRHQWHNESTDIIQQY